MLGLLISTLIVATPPAGYEDLIVVAIDECPHTYWGTVDEDMLEDLIVIEKKYFKKYKIPKNLRGMLLAAACIESGYDTYAKGDWISHGAGLQVARAKGIIQLRDWWTKKYKIDRYDYKNASEAWMKHIVKQRHRIEKLKWCSPRLSDKQKWVGAWIQTMRSKTGKISEHSCPQRSSHHKLLKTWHRLANEHQHSNGCDC